MLNVSSNKHNFDYVSICHNAFVQELLQRSTVLDKKPSASLFFYANLLKLRYSHESLNMFCNWLSKGIGFVS